MKTVISYEAFDGTVFKDELECEVYEFSFLHPYIKELVFLDENDKILKFDSIFCDSYYQDCAKVIIPTDNAYKDFKILAEARGWILFNQITKRGVWGYNKNTKTFILQHYNRDKIGDM